MTEVAIIIPHYNDLDRLLRCLEALEPQLAPDVEIVVVDNESQVSLDIMRNRFSQVRFVIEPRKGAANARNRGVEETTAPLLLFIDADCVAASDWVATARTTLQRHNADLVGGHVGVFDETPPPRTGAQAFETVFAFDFESYITRKGFSGSGNLVTTREVFLATGPFIHGLSEDLNWCHRATALGFRLAYDDTLRVVHPTRSDWLALVQKWRRLTDESFGVNGHAVGRRLAWAMNALLMPASILIHAPKIMFHPRLTGAGERGKAFVTLARIRMLRMGWMLRQAVAGSL